MKFVVWLLRLPNSVATSHQNKDQFKMPGTENYSDHSSNHMSLYHVSGYLCTSVSNVFFTADESRYLYSDTYYTH